MQMETQERRLQLLENFIYLVIWVVVLVMPLWDINQLENTSEVDWKSAFHAWKMICPLLILFLVNNYILLPFLLIRKKSWLYLLFTICAVGLTIIVSIRNMNGQEMHGNRPPWENRDREQVRGERPPMIPERMQRPDPGGFRLPPFIAPHFLIAILIIGVNMAIKFLFKSIRDDHRMKSLEKQTSEAELAYLKHQINPHFFMNTLNNIHALIDIDKGKAQKTVLELSKIMRYVLYDASLPSVPLHKEIHFLSNYIELMKIRYTEQVDIRISLPGEIPNTQIPPPAFHLLPGKRFQTRHQLQERIVHPSFHGDQRPGIALPDRKQPLQCKGNGRHGYRPRKYPETPPPALRYKLYTAYRK